jgi:branched-chain amino acid transport system substrate-binding protein
MIVMNAATSAITTKSDYIARFSMTLPQVSAPMATWAVKNKHQERGHAGGRLRSGIDAEAAFKTNWPRAAAP